MTNLYTKIDSSFSYDKTLINNLDCKEKTEITFEYISDFRSTKVLRTFIGDLSQKLKIEKLWERRLILIVDELNNNAIEYGTKKGDYNKLRIFIDINNNALSLSIEVEDKGNGNLHKSSEEMLEMRKKREKNSFDNHHSIRGRGLFMIIEKLVDKLYFKDSKNGGLIVGITKKLVINL